MHADERSAGAFHLRNHTASDTDIVSARSKDRVSAEYASPTYCCSFDQAAIARDVIAVALLC
jgi:hypothetical protein